MFPFTAPQVTEEAEAAEWAALSQEELNSIHNDLYGENNEANTSIKENDEVRRRGLSLLQEALDNMDVYQKTAYLEALEKAPHLVEKESDPLAFLRCEDYDAWAAARRLVTYWQYRKSIFEGRAFLPMTMNGALMSADVEFLRQGAMLITPNDARGRSVFFHDRIAGTAERKIMMRTSFYVLQCLSEELSAQTCGVVAVCNYQGYDLRIHHDRLFSKKIAGMFLECFPVRPRSFHIFVGTSIGPIIRVVMPVMKHIMRAHFRLRLVVHVGPRQWVLEECLKYGLGPKNLHSVVGGTYTFDDFSQWMSHRMELESTRYLTSCTTPPAQS